MSFYAHAHTCHPRWMAKERGGHRHEHGPGFGRGFGGPRAFGPGGPFGPGPGFGGPGFGGPGFGGPGFGGPGGGPGGGGPWGGGRGRRRRGDVRIALLMLLGEEPRNGYQLMQTIEERSGGRWRPSPGSVYPALSQLEDEGFVRTVDGDSGRTFEITDAGRTHLAEREERTAPWEESSEAPGAGRFQELRTLIPGIAQAVWQVAQVGDDAQWAKAAEILDETRRSLYRILADAQPDDEADES